MNYVITLTNGDTYSLKVDDTFKDEDFVTLLDLDAVHGFVPIELRCGTIRYFRVEHIVPPIPADQIETFLEDVRTVIDQ